MTEVSAGVPQSPDTSLLPTKRRCPFGESPRQMKVPASSLRGLTSREALEYHNNAENEDTTDNAFEVMMQGDQTEQPLEPPSKTDTFSKCWLCEKPSEMMPCTFCERGVCEMCVRQCDKCFGVFCSCCATVKYDRHEDRAMCLGCNHEELKKRRTRATPAQPILKG